MERRNLMQALGAALGIGAIGNAAASTRNKVADKIADGDVVAQDDVIVPGKQPRYDGQFNRLPGDHGGFDHVIHYLAEGVTDFENVTGDEDGLGEEYESFDDPATFFQLGLMKRTREEARADRREAHRHWDEFYGVDFDRVSDMSDEEVLTETAQGENTEGDTIMEEVPTLLHPGIGYTAYVQSGFGVPNNRNTGEDLGSDFDGDTTNRDYRVTNKIRDGGWWVLAPRTRGEEDLDKLRTRDGDKPLFWYNKDGKKRSGGDDKYDFSGEYDGPGEPSGDPPVGLDAAIFDSLPSRMGVFWGEYNIMRGKNEDPLTIHYESRFPTEFRPKSGLLRAFICELGAYEAETDRNPQGLGRVHGTAYPLQTYPEGDGEGPQRGLIGTIKNLLTFPPTYIRPREQDAVGLPGGDESDVPEGRRTGLGRGEGQTGIPGYPSFWTGSGNINRGGGGSGGGGNGGPPSDNPGRGNN